MSKPADLPTLDSFGADLLSTSPFRRIVVVLRPFICALIIVVCFARQWWTVGAVGVGLLFLSVVASAHDLVHSSLGFKRVVNDFLLCAIGLLVLESGHAYRVSHLHHHAHYPDRDDPEGKPAHGSYLGALVAGPTFLFRLFVFAWKRQRHMRGWLALEGGWFVSALLIAIVLGLFILFFMFM